MTLATDSFETKIRRLQRGCKPTVLDLFAGCGGFSLGFKTAGFHLVGAVEQDLAAATTHSRNLLRCHLPESIDIKGPAPLSLVQKMWPGHPRESVDIIVGGPPCQTFARIGRAKLRSEARREADWLDRASLYSQYLRFVKELEPLVIVFENVPDILNYGGGNVAARICEELEKLDYEPACTLLNSAYYGVPQLRERLYLVAYHRSLDCRVRWPAYTHACDLPAGYEAMRAYARRQYRGKPAEADPLDAMPLLDTGPALPAAVSAEQALHDLPRLDAVKMLEQRRWDQRTTQEQEYALPCPPSGSYAHLMRNWPGLDTDASVSAHVTRRLPRDFEIFARMAPGDQYPRAHEIAVELFERELKKLRGRGVVCEPGSEEWEALRKRFVPPYDPKKFPNKWRKIDANRPSRTLMAHLSHDGYSHIHYDSSQARTITVREAARLQSFPDGFRFECSMNDAFKQIGNAVPPLVAYALARQIGQTLGVSGPKDIRQR
jgi:DNA (cytosine-5)-methyltransferase 1